MSAKPIKTILIEAIVVAAGLVALYFAVDYLATHAGISKGEHHVVKLAAAGALFHVACEYTGVNVWYVKDYAKLL